MGFLCVVGVSSDLPEIASMAATMRKPHAPRFNQPLSDIGGKLAKPVQKINPLSVRNYIFVATQRRTQ